MLVFHQLHVDKAEDMHEQFASVMFYSHFGPTHMRLSYHLAEELSVSLFKDAPLFFNSS